VFICRSCLFQLVFWFLKPTCFSMSWFWLLFFMIFFCTHNPNLCFVGSNFQEQGSLNATTKGIKSCWFHFLVYLVFVDCALCAICVFWVRWRGCECISILLQWPKSYSRLGLNSPQIACVFVCYVAFIYVGKFVFS